MNRLWKVREGKGKFTLIYLWREHQKENSIALGKVLKLWSRNWHFDTPTRNINHYMRIFVIYEPFLEFLPSSFISWINANWCANFKDMVQFQTCKKGKERKYFHNKKASWGWKGIWNVHEEILNKHCHFLCIWSETEE